MKKRRGDKKGVFAEWKIKFFLLSQQIIYIVLQFFPLFSIVTSGPRKVPKQFRKS